VKANMEKRQSHAKPSDMHRVFFTFLTSFGLFLGFGLPGLATAQTEAIHAYPDVTREDALTSSELMEVFSDQTHVGSYNFLYRDIQTYNFMEKTSADGTTRHVQGSRIGTVIQGETPNCEPSYV